MKKWLITIVCALIGIATYSYLFNQRTGNISEAEPPNVQITLAEHIVDGMDCDDVKKLMIPLAEFGCVDGDINGLYWDTLPFHFHSEPPPQYEDLDSVLMAYRLEDSNIYPLPRPLPLPKEQYDLKIIHDWCKRNQNRYCMELFCSA